MDKQSSGLALRHLQCNRIDLEKAMTDETQLNIDLAVILGATWEKTSYGQELLIPGSSNQNLVPFARKTGTGKITYYGPDFTRSIDAQEPLRKLVKERRLEEKYMTSLRRFTGISEPQIMIASLGHLGGYYLDWDSIYELAHTPALQRAEAYRKTLS